MLTIMFLGGLKIVSFRLAVNVWVLLVQYLYVVG